MKNLKAIAAATLAVALSFSLVACSSSAASSTTTSTDVAEDVVEDAVEEVEEVGAAALGFGLIGAAGSGEGSATANTTVAAVLVDEAGAIIDVKIDVAQCYVYSEAGVWSAPETYLTKMELADDYGMGDYSTLEAGEWYQQQTYFMSYVIGMTADEVAAIGIEENYPTDEDLLAGCTIKITDYVGAVLLAMENATEYNCTVEDTLSLAIDTPVATGTDAADEDGKVSLTTTIAALVVSTEGIVNDVYIDATQPSFTNTADDVITGAGEVLSKQQKEYDYGMLAYSTLEAGEWFEQQAYFMAYVVGMEASELGNIEYDEDTHAVDADLLAGCTIKINSYVELLAKAVG
ncbi:MAG: hypothetical protein R3Y06_02260 [Faecalibacterium sp.]